MTERRPPVYIAYHFLWSLLDWLFPPICGGCNKSGYRWCEKCQQDTQKIDRPICEICGRPLTTIGICPECIAQRPAYTALRSWGIYGGPLRNAILRLKYGRDMGIAEALSKHIIELYNGFQWNINLVVPVPLSTTRRKKRGYNQAGLLAMPLAQAIGRTYRPAALKRIRETQSQVHLGAQERRRNVQNAFQAIPAIVSGMNVLIIDDVTTTGSTIDACAHALTRAGASAVFGITLARAVLQADVDDQPT